MKTTLSTLAIVAAAVIVVFLEMRLREMTCDKVVLIHHEVVTGEDGHLIYRGEWKESVCR